MFGTCFNECVSSFSTANLTANEGKCLKTCYGAYAKKFEVAGQAMGYDAKLNFNFKWKKDNRGGQEVQIIV